MAFGRVSSGKDKGPKDISFFRHFWHVVEGAAFERPACDEGPRYMQAQLQRFSEVGKMKVMKLNVGVGRGKWWREKASATGRVRQRVRWHSQQTEASERWWVGVSWRRKP